MRMKEGEEADAGRRRRHRRKLEEKAEEDKGVEVEEYMGGAKALKYHPLLAINTLIHH